MTADTQQPAAFDAWCIVEIMGRTTLAGRVTEFTLAGAGFLQINVPATSRQAAWSKLLAPGSIHSITKTTEEIATYRAEALNAAPLEAYDLPETVKEAIREGRQVLSARRIESSPVATPKPRPAPWENDDDDFADAADDGFDDEDDINAGGP